jgi:phosphoribosylformylglycinamidine cyclo-ligase
VADEEMFRVFNMGIGFVVICGKDCTHKVLDQLTRSNVPAWVIGEVHDGEVGVQIE